MKAWPIAPFAGALMLIPPLVASCTHRTMLEEINILPTVVEAHGSDSPYVFCYAGDMVALDSPVYYLLKDTTAVTCSAFFPDGGNMSLEPIGEGLGFIGEGEGSGLVRTYYFRARRPGKSTVEIRLPLQPDTLRLVYGVTVLKPIGAQKP